MAIFMVVFVMLVTLAASAVKRKAELHLRPAFSAASFLGGWRRTINGRELPWC
jgi:hypothetical protein